ncbi:MAG: ABC transporter ATP-binding protein [Verrucomicrobia bacterium]|nr:MAG: ABC transporter ATP-binding protein [Verrucomicrobiota bacterium]PYL96982.1 MAG: ABC transporter ATP-binding protein [Verrucomicrobiota bacterium]
MDFRFAITLANARLVQSKIQNPQSKIDMSIYRRVLRYYRPFLPQTVVGLLLSLIGIGLNLLKPWPFKIIVDDFLRPNPTPRGDWHTWLPLLCLALVAIQFFWGLINWATNYILVKVGLQALLKLRTDLYAYLQSLSLKYHDVRRSSDLSFRVAYDSQSIQTIYNKGFTGIFGSVVTLIGTFAIMVQLDWQLTLLSLGIVPLIILAIYFFAHRIRRESTFIQEQESAVLAQAQEGLSSIRMVHAFGREQYEVMQFHQQAQQSLQANLRLTLTNVNSALVISTLMVLGTAAMYYVGTLHVLAGTLTLGTLLIFSAYLLMLYQPLESITYTAWAMEGATAGARRCFEVLDREDDVADSPNAVAIESAKGAIGFQNVSFGYALATASPPGGGQGRLVLHDVDLRIEPNQMIAIVGGTGAGKSTLLSLVPRFYDPTFGSVALDGRNVREIKKKSLRAQIGIVLQDTLLFSTTIRENIAYGRPDARDDEIIDAAKRAQADEFICQLPNGYGNTVGERGGQLSVGQRQRIGIARAFLKNAPVLLLDEPTSALDPTTEAAIMETIKDLMRGRTTLIATHRLATIHDVDRIVVLERGRIVEQGRGAELLARGGVYARLFASGKFPT